MKADASRLAAHHRAPHRGSVAARAHRPPPAAPDEVPPAAYDDDDAHGRVAFPEPEPGRVRIGPDVISPETLNSLSELSSEIKLGKSLSPGRLQQMFTDIRDGQSVARDDLKAFDAFVRSMRAWHRKLHVQFRRSDYHDPKLDANLLKAHQFLTQWDGARERYRIQARTQELSRISQGSPSFNPTTAGFYTFADMSQRDMKKTLAVMDGISLQDPGVYTTGNSARMLTRDEIWQAKMRLLDEAIADAKQGHPVEIDVQYYELTSHSMLSKLAEAARAGNKLRVNMDPGRIAIDREGNGYASEIAKKLQTAYRLLDVRKGGADVAVTFFPVEREISGNLMHQKLFRVGEKVILGGMNANSASGENVDAAVILEGPGARRLVGVFMRDTGLSQAARLKEIYDPARTAKISAGGMWVGPAGLLALLLDAAGPRYRGVDAPVFPKSAATLDRLAKAAHTRLDLLVDFDDANGDGHLSGADLQSFLDKGEQPRNVLPLKREGGRLLARQLKDVVERLNRPDNVKRAGDVTLPVGAVHGKETLVVGDSPRERAAILLQAISTAEQFIYVPTFVMTRTVARAIVARYEELKAQGRQLDVRVVLDPGLYPEGGTPNEAGYLALEDAGIPVKWALLPRTREDHARKIHAKELITEKMAMLGSTNMSSRGLMDNWELSGVVVFDSKDPEATRDRDHLVADFMKTWDDESLRIDTRAVAEDRLADRNTPDKAARIEESRHRVIFEAIHLINTVERESTPVIHSLLIGHPELLPEIQRKTAAGMTRGYAILTTLEERLGKDAVRQAIEKSANFQELQSLCQGRFKTAAPHPASAA